MAHGGGRKRAWIAAGMEVAGSAASGGRGKANLITSIGAKITVNMLTIMNAKGRLLWI